MAYVTLTEAKKQINVDAAFTADDSYISMLIDVATEAVENHIDGSLAERFGDGAIPSPIKAAILLLIGTLYNDRQATTEKALQMPVYNYLLSPYRLVR